MRLLSKLTLLAALTAPLAAGCNGSTSSTLSQPKMSEGTKGGGMMADDKMKGGMMTPPTKP